MSPTSRTASRRRSRRCGSIWRGAIPTGASRAGRADRRHVRHHLGRARAATMPAARQRRDAAAAHARRSGRGARAHPCRARDAPTSRSIRRLAVRCDPQDLDEMLGNLLDNAWRWARNRVTIAAEAQGREIAIRIADDGPGLADASIARATEPGWRLDEARRRPRLRPDHRARTGGAARRAARTAQPERRGPAGDARAAGDECVTSPVRHAGLDPASRAPSGTARNSGSRVEPGMTMILRRPTRVRGAWLTTSKTCANAWKPPPHAMDFEEAQRLRDRISADPRRRLHRRTPRRPTPPA